MKFHWGSLFFLSVAARPALISAPLTTVLMPANAWLTLNIHRRWIYPSYLSSGVGPPAAGGDGGPKRPGSSAGGRDLLEHLDGTTEGGGGGARKLHGDDVSSRHPLIAK